MRYKDLPDWVKEQRREMRKELNNPTNWGGKRPGSGRPRTGRATTRMYVPITVNRIQKMNLEEMGNGDLMLGLQALIDNTFERQRNGRY